MRARRDPRDGAGMLTSDANAPSYGFDIAAILVGINSLLFDTAVVGCVVVVSDGPRERASGGAASRDARWRPSW